MRGSKIRSFEGKAKQVLSLLKERGGEVCALRIAFVDSQPFESTLRNDFQSDLEAS